MGKIDQVSLPCFVVRQYYFLGDCTNYVSGDCTKYFSGDCTKPLHPNRPGWVNFLLAGTHPPQSTHSHSSSFLTIIDVLLFYRGGTSENERTNRKLQRLTVTTRCKMDLRKYPLDSQVTKKNDKIRPFFIFMCLFQQNHVILCFLCFLPLFSIFLILNLHGSQVCPVHIGSFGHNSDEVIIS